MRNDGLGFMRRNSPEQTSGQFVQTKNSRNGTKANCHGTPLEQRRSSGGTSGGGASAQGAGL